MHCGHALQRFGSRRKAVDYSALTATLTLLATGLAPAPFLVAQASSNANTALEFEVASIKPSHPGSLDGGIRPAPGGRRYLASSVSLQLLIQVAYSVKAEQISGGPGWMASDRWDMNAEADRPSSSEELHMMLRNLLKERFKLDLRHDTKDLPAYILSIDKGGPKMKEHPAANGGEPWIDQKFDQEGFHFTATSVPMSYFAWRLSMMMDRPILDRTAIHGSYDFELLWSPETLPGVREGATLNGVRIGETSAPDIYAAVRQQLGLKLEAQKAPVQILVVVHTEKPAEN
jgi:uncharacterized protein (TIGR03435 family)